MKWVLFILLFALGTFAAETANGSSAQADGVSVQQDSSTVQADSVAAQGSQVYLICDMDDIDEDPETSVKNSIGLVNDSLGPLENYVNLPDSATNTSATVTDSSVAQSDSTLVANDSAMISTDSALVSAEAEVPMEEPVFRETPKSIPLPRQTAYTGKGLSVGIGAGVFQPTVDCDCMGVWQGQVEFFYSDWISGGGDVRYFGGNLDKSSMLMYQRYRIDARFHKTWTNFDIYAEPVFGFETTSISEFRSQVKNDLDGFLNGDTATVAPDTSKKELTECERMFSLDGFSIGVGGGFGWKPIRYVGVTGSVMMEYSFSNSLLLSITPGLAFNVMEFWRWGRENLRSIWISAEFGTQRYFNRGVGDWSLHGILGIQLTI